MELLWSPLISCVFSHKSLSMQSYIFHCDGTSQNWVCDQCFFFPKNKNFLEFFVFLVEIRWSLLFFWKHLPNICYHKIGGKKKKTWLIVTKQYFSVFSRLGIISQLTCYGKWHRSLQWQFTKYGLWPMFFFLQKICFSFPQT